MYAQVAIKPNPLLRNGAYGIVMRGVQKCTRGCSSLRGRNKLPLCCIKLDTATEPLCGSGRFLVPFLERGFDISGMDLSEEMLVKLKRKAPNAKVIQANIINYTVQEKFDYIFIPSGSVSLFTDMDMCQEILRKMKELLLPSGKFVFSVDTVFDRCNEDVEYKVNDSVKTKEGYDLILKGKNHYDENSQTQYSPSIYELYNGAELLQSETMDFQTHLYRYGEMEEYLREVGFKSIEVYSDYQKKPAVDDKCEMFIYECGI